ncbi:ATP-grasp domain-containing protein [Kordiimonas pumila]|uniref:ATP-grasp domain-containing protein n=1 Tax=Kordiimonas pumila TaxID=2161677 RepID=A0ABV7D0S8_9PROT|nr:ATP-grasp domain-containing protein [Kordiimonas pumila]
MMNILITSISAKVQLVQAFKDAVRPYGGLIVGTDMDPKCCAAHFVDMFEALPRDDNPAYKKRLLEICKTHKIRLIIPTRDAELEALVDIKADLAALGTALPLPDSEALHTCLDKRLFHSFCVAEGYPVLPVVDPQMENNFPLFVRAINTANGKEAYEVPNMVAWNHLGLDRSHYICQPLCTDNEYSCDILLDLDGMPLQAVVRHRQRLVNGESWRSEIVDMPRLEAMTLEICQKLGLKGHNLAQAFVGAAGDIHLIEINPRFGGCSNLSIAGGLASPVRLVEMVRGETEEAARKRPITIGLQSNRYSMDIYTNTGNSAAGINT